MSSQINTKGFKGKSEISNGILILLFIMVVCLNFFISYIFPDFSKHNYLFIAVWLILFLKITIVDRLIVNKPIFYYLGKVFDIVLSFTAVSIQGAYLVTFLLLLVIIIDSAFKKDSEGTKITAIFGLTSYVELVFFWYLKNEITPNNIIFIIFNLVILTIISQVIYKIALEKEKIKTDMKSEIDELKQFKEESDHSNAEIKCQITDLEIKNKKISKNLARFSTLQQINQVINSTLNLEELLKLVVDMIIGVIGVKYCTIFLKEDSTEKLSVGSTNIKDTVILKTIKEKVALRLFNILEGGQRVLSNNIDIYTYPGAMDRGIECAIFVPIVKGGKVLGLIIAEHAVEHGMDDESKKFIEAIASQIGVAIENARLYDEMEKIATTDGLTKIYNRMFFQQNYIKIFEEAKSSNQPLCAMMMDIDFFKKFNDNYGHDFGDEVLRSTAQLIKNNLDSNGMIARYGGEEFIVLFKNTTLDQGYKLSEELRKKVESNIVQFNGKAIKITVSMGISEFPHVVTNDKDLLKSADEALYQAKGDGRNCVKKGFIVSRPTE